MNKQLVFIASGGRTGTQFFGDMLRNVVSDCYSEHEPDLFAGLSRRTLSRIGRFGLWHMSAGRLLGFTGVRVLGQRLLEGSLDHDSIRERLRATRQAYHSGITQSLIVESYYAWWMVAGQIDEIWPGAKLAGVIRDPRNWIASWQRHLPKRRAGTMTERLPPGPLTPAKLGDTEAAEVWQHLDPVGRMAWEWALICRTLDQAAATNPNVRVFRFEDLFLQDRTELHHFADFISEHATGPTHKINGLDAAVGEVRNASRGNKRGWQDWSDAQVAAVAHFCQEMMERHGYGGEPEWQACIKRAGSL